MSLVLPTDPAIRELIDLPALARKEWVTFRQAKASAAKLFEGETGVNRVFSQAIRANGDIHLLSIGPRGGHKTIWNFGNAIGQ